MKFLRRHVCEGCGEPLDQLASWDELCFRCRTSLPQHETLLGTHCPICGQATLSEQGLCTDCRSRPWSFNSLIGLTPYQLPAGYWTAIYKKAPKPHLAKIIIRQLSLNSNVPGIIVPVPAHRGHRRNRGWDPVARVANEIRHRTGWPLVQALKRKSTASQKTLSRVARLENARCSYLWTGKKVIGKICWLIDDVVTTGATVDACARILKDAGACEVHVICLALH